MKFTISRDVQVHCPLDKSESVKAVFAKYPILATAALICQEKRQPTNLDALHDLASLIDEVAPDYPYDSFDAGSLASLLNYESVFSVQEYRTLRDLLPNTRNLRPHVRAGADFALTFHVLPKQGGCFQVAFSGSRGLASPFEVEATLWADMDDPANHHEDCPENNADNAENYECDCEAGVVHRATRTVAEWNDAVKNEIEEWICQQVGW